jgi:adenylylsulfate kinase-like enzyme
MTDQDMKRVLLTGLQGAGKSTVGNLVLMKINDKFREYEPGQ